MLTLVTGTPGAGKTLNTIKSALKLQEEDDSRKVFFFNIPECSVPGWTELDENGSHNWMDLPQGSIIIVDEAYKIWPQRGPKVEVGESASKLAEHRHKGFDFFIITQSPKNLDVFVRRLIGQHFHYDRRFGAKTVNRYQWNRIEEEPNDQWKKKEAVRTSIKFDPKIYDLYKSAEIHTHKRSYPPKLILGVVFICSAPFLIYFFGTSLNMADVDDEILPVETTSNLPWAEPATLPGSTGTYVSNLIPRIHGYPHTAPIYDEMTKPVTYPKYNCLHPTNQINKCKCYSQQATLLDVPVAICLSIIEKGLFDPARPDVPYQSSPREGGNTRPDSRPVSPDQSNRVIFIGSQGRSPN